MSGADYHALMLAAAIISDFLGETDHQPRSDESYILRIGDLEAYAASRGHQAAGLAVLIEDLGGSVLTWDPDSREGNVYRIPSDFRERVGVAPREVPAGRPEAAQGATVLSLRGGANTLPDQPVEDVVTTLERLLDDARSGRIRGMVYAIAVTNGQYATGWTQSADQGAWDRMIAGTGILNYRMMRAANGDDQE